MRRAGGIVDCDMRKWRDRPHYRFEGERLGRDRYGTWIGCRAPTPFTGPDGAGTFSYDFVLCAPVGGWWIASFFALTEMTQIETYVDITTPPRWPAASHLSAVDLDLDVVHTRDGRVFLDDEDEFEEHRIAYGYPDDVVRRARAAAREMLAAVEQGAGPFGGAGLRWLERLAG